MKYLRRFVWFLAFRLTAAALILGLAVCAFYYAMNLTNVQIVLKDGLARRAQVVMRMEDGQELTKYFQQTYLERDAALLAAEQGTSPYQNYTIRGIDHRIDLGFTWIWPWDDTARVDVTERLPHIDGRIKGSKAEEAVAAGGPSAVYPPAWASARYRVTLVKESGRWMIKSMTLLENLTE
ncbi:MAG: hypothetical protein IKP40_09730 [Clostridia bacterium]|nr:hypothetical protein [Clostridia bacterium]